MVEERVNGLVVDRDAESRMRLKGVTSSLYQFGIVQLCPTTREAAAHLNDGHEWHIVFLSSQLESVAISEFIKLGRSNPSSRDAAYVLLVGPDDQTKTALAENVLLGADGLLCSPYSAEGLAELTRLAAKMKSEKMRERKAAAVRLLASDATIHLDQVAWAILRHQPPGPAARALRELGETLKTLDAEWHQVFYDALTAQCEGATPFVRPKATSSKRVQKILDRQEQKSRDPGYRIVKR